MCAAARPRGGLDADAQDLLHLQRPAAADQGFEGLAVDELHDQVGHRGVVADGVDGDDVVVADGGGGAGLADEAPTGGAGGGQRCRQHLDGDDAQELGVAGTQNDAHAAAADDFEDLVMIQSAERAGLGRWGEEGEVRGIFNRAQCRHALGFHDRALQELTNFRMRGEQRVDPAAQRLVARTCFIQVGETLRRRFLQGRKEYAFRR